MSTDTASRQPADPDECDLVMKGGITSGVVYPSAVLRLKKRYRRFRNIGGTSAGAIAAVVTAAAEYGDQTHAGEGAAYDALQETVRALATPGFMLSLFQPTRATRPMFDVVIASLREPDVAKTPPGSTADPDAEARWRRARTRHKAISMTRAVLRPERWIVALGAIVGLAVWLGVTSLGVGAGLVTRPGRWSGGAIAFAVLVAIAVTVIAVVIAVAIALALAARSAYASLGANGFGLCPGMHQDGFDGAGLSDWLHDMVQRCAGLPADRPLTIGDLQANGIRLETVTTNLNYSRPFRLPFEESGRFLFEREQLTQIFPPAVLDWMVAHPPDGVNPPPEGLSWVPAAEDFPALVAARMSLSFPLLFSAVPLHAVDEANPEKPVVENWFSDGGISSNFPIHFFDGWLPSRPTFGLNLGEYPTDGRGRRLSGMQGRVDGAGDDWATGGVFMPATREDGRFPRWFHFSSVGGFIARIADTMENWRDNMQAELPGFRDRICEIRLDEDQGGMHLTMPADRIQDLIDKGRAAGDRLADHFGWTQHRWTRYLMLMETFQVRLEGDERHPAADAVHPRFDALYSPMLADGPPNVGDYVENHDAAWCVRARDATSSFLAGSAAWRRAAMQFRLTDGAPAWVMRLTPKV